jgi:hypothetical protein
MKKTIEHFLGPYGRSRWDEPGDRAPLDEILDVLTDGVDWWISGCPGFMKKGPVLIPRRPMERHRGRTAHNRADRLEIQGNRAAVEAHSTMKLKSGHAYNHYRFLFERWGRRSQSITNTLTAHTSMK